MKTENLIEALVADRATGRRTIPKALATALAFGSLLSLVLFFAAFGVRKDFVQALATWRFDLKIGLVLVSLVSAFGLCMALSRPVPSDRPLWRLLPLAALAAMAVAIELAVLPALHGKLGW